MKNDVQAGNVLELAAPYDRLSGEGALVGGLFCVAVKTVLNGVSESFVSEGVVEIKKENTTAAFAEGEIVYWNDTAKQLDESAAGRFPCGTCTKAAIATDATVEMKLFGYATAAV